MKKIIVLICLLASIIVIERNLYINEFILSITHEMNNDYKEACRVIKKYNSTLSDNDIHSIAFSSIKYARRYNIDHIWLLSIIYVESNFRPKAYGKTQDYGLCQITKSALDDFNKYNDKNYSIEDMYDIDKNIEVGCWYIRYHLDNNNNIYRIAIAKYNAGKYYDSIGYLYYSKVSVFRDKIAK